MPAMPSMPKPPSALGGDYNQWQQKQQGQPLDPPGHPTRGPAQPGDLKNLPSVESAGISDVDYSHLPQGEPMTGFSPSSGGGGGQPGGFGGAGGSSTAPTGAPTGHGGPGAPSTYTPSGGVDQWQPQIEEALRRNNLPVTPEYINKVKTQVKSESSGNPKAINNTDSNAQAGHPSQGLLQTIPGTFNQYHLPGDSQDITDPQANLDSAIGYAKSRYGPSLMNEQGTGIGSGHAY